MQVWWWFWNTIFRIFFGREFCFGFVKLLGCIIGRWGLYLGLCFKNILYRHPKTIPLPLASANSPLANCTRAPSKCEMQWMFCVFHLLSKIYVPLVRDFTNFINFGKVWQMFGFVKRLFSWFLLVYLVYLINPPLDRGINSPCLAFFVWEPNSQRNPPPKCKASPLPRLYIWSGFQGSRGGGGALYLGGITFGRSSFVWVAWTTFGGLQL